MDFALPYKFQTRRLSCRTPMKNSIVILILRNTRYYRVVTVLMSLEQGFSTGVNFTYPWGKFNDAEVAILHFFLQR